MLVILVACGDRNGVERHYLPALRASGWTGEFRVLPTSEPRPSLKSVSGLLLTGGLDVHPRHWDPSEAVHAQARPDLDRDEREIDLIREAWELHLPILGICRGEQILNVALGGSLVQDIPAYYGCEPERHQHGDADLFPDLRHRVTLAPGSRLAGILRGTSLLVNSRHHQAVLRVAPELRACAWHLDTGSAHTGPLVEAVEAQDPDRWAFGVQWHPENLLGLEGEVGAMTRRLFRAFLAQAG